MLKCEVSDCAQTTVLEGSVSDDVRAGASMCVGSGAQPVCLDVLVDCGVGVDFSPVCFQSCSPEVRRHGGPEVFELRDRGVEDAV